MKKFHLKNLCIISAPEAFHGDFQNSTFWNFEAKIGSE